MIIIIFKTIIDASNRCSEFVSAEKVQTDVVLKKLVHNYTQHDR